MRRIRCLDLLFLLSILPLLSSRTARAQQTGALKAEYVGELLFRELGPAVAGGRVHDVEAVPGRPATIYVGAASGGVWKSINGGTTWRPLWNDLPNSSIGDIALAPSNPEIIYVGTGGPNNRQSTLYGNGVWKSTDGGETWTHLGLVETRHIGRIQVHPADPDIVYVAALGNLWKANRERGVFKSTDGGRSWRKVLYIDEDTGAVDLVIDPEDPRILYAATYQRRRRTFGFNGGGPGSGIYKSTDGGESWSELTNGIPEGDKGRIGLAIARTNPKVLNATIEHGSASGTYRTEDGGATWEQVSRTNPRPMYYSHIYIDPTDQNRVYVLGTTAYVSTEGGRNLRALPSRQSYDFGVHSDHHALWIDPGNPEFLILGGDAGIHMSWDRGITWRRFNNFVIGQFYGIGVDMREPYRVYGGMQDNHSWMGPSRTRRVIGIVNDDWRQTGFGDGMYAQPDPLDYRRVYLDANDGNLTRFDPETGSSESIRPAPPPGEPRYRFDWTAPILISPHDRMRIYFGGNRLFISEDGGDSWRRTEDLSRRIDRDALPIMGVMPGPGVLARNDGTGSYGEIVTVDESPLVEGVLWVGTDDGNLQVSRDGGAVWTNVAGNVPGVPEGTYVSRVVASHAAAGRAYATFDAHRDGDFQPYVFVTEDYGRTWTEITTGLPREGSVNVIREHPANPDFLIVGTEHALFISLDRGRNWMQLKNNFPTAPIDDLLIHPRENDLVLGTHGRGIWILEDLTPLSEFSREVASSPLHLFSIRSPMQYQKWKATSYRGHGEYAAAQPLDGAVINYWLGAEVRGPVEIEIVSEEGRVVRHLQGPGGVGLHRVLWDLRMDPAPAGGPGRSTGRGSGRAGFQPALDPNMTPRLQEILTPRAPWVLPAAYTVRLKAGERTVAGTVVVRPDPMDRLTPAQRRARWTFLVEADDLQRMAFREGEAVRELRSRVRRARSEADRVRNTALSGDLEALDNELNGVLQALNGEIRRGAGGLLGRFSAAGARQGTLAGPTPQQRERLAQLGEQAARVRETMARVRNERVPALDERLRAAGLPTLGGGRA